MSSEAVDLFGRLPSRHRARGAFTLLEVLIVLGIIALLATILLAVLSKAREAGRRTTCLSNLRSIVYAINNYVDANEGFYPFAAAKQGTVGAPPNGGHQYGDWVYWQSTATGGGTLPIDQIGTGGIGPYLHLDDRTPGGISVLRCPADERVQSIGVTSAASPYNGYPFSYVLNSLMSSGNADLGPVPGNNPQVAMAKAARLVKDAGSKILVFEEDARTIDDGNGILLPNANNTNMLSVRHDSVPVGDDPIAANIVPGTNGLGLLRMSNQGAHGNVGFCDGHAEYVERGYAHSAAHYAPDPTMFPNYP